MVQGGWTKSDLSEGLGAVLQFIAVVPYPTPLEHVSASVCISQGDERC
jgi:hypothetical protein